MQAQMNDVIMTLVKTLGALLGIAGTWLLLRLQAYIAAHTKNARVSGVLSRLSTTAASIVQEVEQTFISTLTEPTADDLKKAKDQAMATLRSHLGPKGLQEVETVLGLDGSNAVERVLNTAIESAVHDLKITKEMVGAPGATLSTAVAGGAA